MFREVSSGFTSIQLRHTSPSSSGLSALGETVASSLAGGHNASLQQQQQQQQQRRGSPLTDHTVRRLIKEKTRRVLDPLIDALSTGPFAHPLVRSLAPPCLLRSLAPLHSFICWLAHSRAPELMGKRFLSTIQTRRFHTICTPCGSVCLGRRRRKCHDALFGGDASRAGRHFHLRRDARGGREVWRDAR